MVFKKKELEFLKVFQLCGSGGTLSDQINIIARTDDAKVYFCVIDDKVKFIQEKAYTGTTDFVVSYSLSQINAMLGFCNEEDDITIDGEKIKFGLNSEYKFETKDFNIEQFELLMQTSLEGEIIEIKDTQKIDKVNFSISTDQPELSCIAFQDNYFITYKAQSDSSAKILSFIKSENTIEDNFYLPYVFYKLYSIYKFNSISIKKISDEFLYMNINDMRIYMAVGDYSIPYIFDEGIKSKFEHEDKIVIQKEALKTALSRIKVLNQKTKYNRVFIYFNESGIKLEIKDDYKGFEDITATVDEKLKDFYIICSTASLYEILSNIVTDNVIIRLSAIDDLSVIKVTDSEEKQNHVLTLSKKYADSE